MRSRQILPALTLFLLVGSRVTAQTSRQAPSNPFLGSVSKGTVTPESLPLSVKDAVRRALENNLGLLLQEESEATALGARWRALADLLPNVAGGLRSSRQVINLEAYGFPAAQPIVGPFNVHDARVYLSQPVIDLSAWNESRATSLKLQAEKYGVRTARDLVVLVAVNLYLEAVTSASRVEMTRAQRSTAEALFAQAQDLKTAGIVAGIDVLRAQGQLQTQRQRVIAAESDFEKAKLQLARAIGLPLAQAFTLTDKIPYAPMPAPSLDEVLARALDARPDFLAAKSRVEAAQASIKAADGALLPSLRFDADYGAIGQTYSDAHSTFSVAATVHIPVFDGGRTKARRIEAGSTLRSARRSSPTSAAGSIRVRAALLDLRAADQQLQASDTNRQLADAELAQARDRFGAGVASNLEITQAQESVAAASEQYIAALYSHNLAKASLARALGIAESAVANYLGGAQ
jgi:outer membrane protein TolC